MKCYNHPGTEAVGFCSICRRGVCNSCQVIMDGERFCKQHAAGQIRRDEHSVSNPKRGAAITLASAIAVLDGFAGLIIGFLLIILAILAPTAETPIVIFSWLHRFLEYFANVVRFPPIEAMFIGLAIFLLGIIDMYAGYQLWGRSKIAGVVSVSVAIAGGVIIGGYLEILALAGVFVSLYIASSIVKIVALGFGWKHLGNG